MTRTRDPTIESLAAALARRTREAAPALVETLDQGRVRCLACGHRCVIPPGREGICRVRFNEAGTLRVPRGYVVALDVEPIEKKPFFHALPGAQTISFGMPGCDLHCPYCQNWLTSQALRDPAAAVPIEDVEPETIVEIGRRAGATVCVSTYNEPLITSEWAVEIFEPARRAGMTCGFVSNGNATPEVLRYLRPTVDLFKIDLKSFRERSYHKLGGVLERVLDGIRRVYEMGFWLEIVTLLVPGFNDDEAEVRDMARFIASISHDIPWHVTAFHPDYKMLGARPTTVEDIARAVAIGREAGLRYVYGGNLAGRNPDLEDTRCPRCETVLIERRGLLARVRELGPTGACLNCGEKIPGFWQRPGD